MTDFGRRAGVGDMLKSTYDPNEDGVIAVAQTEADVGDMLKSDYDPNEDGVIALAQTEADIKAAGVAVLIGDHAAFPNVHHTPPTADPGEGFIFLDPGSYHEILQGTYHLYVAASSFHVGGINNTSGDDQDALTWKAYMAAGTYTMVWIGRTATYMGIIDFYVDATEVASHDLYSNPQVNATIKKQTGIVVASSGIKTIKMIADGKNVSSSAYQFMTECIVFYRTA